MSLSSLNFSLFNDLILWIYIAGSKQSFGELLLEFRFSSQQEVMDEELETWLALFRIVLCNFTYTGH